MSQRQQVPRTRQQPQLPARDLGRDLSQRGERHDEVQRRRPGVPVILSSGHHEEIVTRGLRRDVLTFLQKPWQLSRLLAAVEQALSSKKPVS